MKVIVESAAAKDSLAYPPEQPEKPLDIALCTIIPKSEGTFSVQLPAADWEDGLQAVYTFAYGGTLPAGEAVLHGTMRVVPVTDRFAGHCAEAADGNVTQDCALYFEKGKTIDIQSDVMVALSAEEVLKLNAFLQRWSKR